MSSSWFSLQKRRVRGVKSRKPIFASHLFLNNNNNNNCNNQDHLVARSKSLPRTSSKKIDPIQEEAMALRIFNMRQPTNLTGRFPSTVVLHAKVEDLVGQPPLVPGQVPNMLQPLSLLPDWRWVDPPPAYFNVRENRVANLLHNVSERFFSLIARN